MLQSYDVFQRFSWHRLVSLLSHVLVQPAPLLSKEPLKLETPLDLLTSVISPLELSPSAITSYSSDQPQSPTNEVSSTFSDEETGMTFVTIHTAYMSEWDWCSG